MMNQIKVFSGILLFLGILLVSGSTLAADAKKDGIMVWRIEAKKDVSLEDVESLSGYLDAEVEKYSGRAGEFF